MVTNLAVVGVVTVAWAAVLAIVRRHPGAPFFGLAWGVLLLGVTILTLHNNGLVPSNLFTANALLIGSSLEMVLLSYARWPTASTPRKEKGRRRRRSRGAGRGAGAAGRRRVTRP